MSLARLTRFPSFPSLFADFDELLRDPGNARPLEAGAALVPAADVAETDKTIEIHLDLPGMTADKIDVKLEGDLLTVMAERQAESTETKRNWVRTERSWGKFVRTFTLPDSVAATTPEASYKNGVLGITLYKKENVQPKSVKVKVEA